MLTVRLTLPLCLRWVPAGGFSASFHTRTRSGSFSFVVVGDEGFFPVVPNSSPPAIVDYEARIAHLINNTANLSVPGVPRLPAADLILNTGDNIYINNVDNPLGLIGPQRYSDSVPAGRPDRDRAPRPESIQL